jgi:hypothetical protein
LISFQRHYYGHFFAADAIFIDIFADFRHATADFRDAMTLCRYFITLLIFRFSDISLRYFRH